MESITRLILGTSSLWIFIPWIYYHIYLKKYIFVKNLIISSAFVSIKYWSISKQDNIYLNIDRTLARILYIYI